MTNVSVGDQEATTSSAQLARAEEMKQHVVKETKKNQRNHRRLVLVGRILLVFGFLAVWEFGSGRFLDPFFFSKPSAIAISLYSGIFGGDLLWHTQLTVIETVAGYLVGASVALLFALVVGLANRLYEILEPLIVAFNGIPRIALAPLFIAWFGIGITPKIVIAALMVFFIVFMNTVGAIRSVNYQLIDISRVMGATKRQLVQKVILPTVMPTILVSLRIVVPLAMTGAIVGEFISSQRGLGYYISQATYQMNIANAFAGVFVLLVVILLMNGLVSWAEHRLQRWSYDERV